MVETHKSKSRKCSNNTNNLISNTEHIKHTLSTSKPYRHQQHLYKKILKTSLELYGWQFHMEEIPANSNVGAARRPPSWI